MKTKLLLIFAILFSGSAFAQEVGRVTYVEGRVDILKPGAKEAVMIKADEPVTVGAFIRTKSDSKAEIVFKDESVVRLAQNSRIQVKDYQLVADKRKTATILLERGKARTTIAKMPGQAPFIILTPNAQGTIKGSDIFSFYQAGNSGMLVAEGVLSVFNTARPDEVVSVKPGEAVLISLQEAPKGPREFMEMEKRMEEVETNIPPALSRRKSMAVIMGTLVKFSGEVNVISKGKSALHPARPNERLEAGDRIQTGKNGVAEIVFDNGNAMYLKTNTDITITKLINDPETQEYENLFDVKVGKIKARIERLSGKSKFEVRTPTAVCGARGTIMYLGVAETGETESFFEGGTGFVTSLENNQTEFVGSGEKAGVSADGTVLDSAAVSESEQMSFDEGFDPGTGTEDQGSLEGGAGAYLPGTGDGTEAQANEAEAAAMEATLTEGDPATGEIFIDIPITEAGTVEEGSNPEPGPLVIGEFYTTSVIGADPVLVSNGSLYDFFFGVNFSSLWMGSPAPITITGKYGLTDSSPYHIWTDSEGNFFSHNSSTGTYTTPDGGAFYGLSGGITGNISGSDTMEGLLAALYIDPSGKAGYFTGFYSGSNSTNFNLTGSASSTVKVGSGIGITPDNLYYNVSDGSFSGIGNRDLGGGNFIKANLSDGKAMNIDTAAGKDWGIWGARIAGTFNGNLTPLLPWYLQISGPSGDSLKNDGGWLGKFSATQWSGNKFSASMEGSLVETQPGGILVGTQIHGNLMGTYIDVPVGDDTWQAVACGNWQKAVTPLDTSNWANLDAGINTINLSVPITVVDTALAMSGGGTFSTGGSVTVASMDMHFYALFSSPLPETNGIWASLLSGSFVAPGTLSDVWSATVNNTGPVDIATFSGTQWSGGQWRADVTGTANSGATSFSGAATGTYSGSTFTGAGTGEWSTP